MNSRYAKAILAFLIAVGGALVTALGTSPQQNLSHFDTVTWLTTIGAILATPALTALVENMPGIAGGIIKAIVGSGGAFLTSLIAAYADNVVTQGEWIGAVCIGLTALAGIYQVTNVGMKMVVRTTVV